MSVLLTTLLSSLIPVGIEGVKQLIVSKTGVQATTVDEQIKLDDQEIKRLEAIAKLDTPGGTPSQWVVDLRASSRYVAAGVVILGGVAAIYIPGLDPKVVAVGLEAANCAFGFLFGQRIVTNFKK